MKYSLLEMTQEILSAMDSDEVNSITDTTESLQVARIIRQSFLDMAEDLNLPEHYTLFELEPSLDNSKPTLMFVPDDVNYLTSVKYDTIALDETVPNIRDVMFLSREMFFDQSYQLNTSDTNVGSYTITTLDSSTIPVNYTNNKAPQFYTTFDDNQVIFDSYDASVDTTLQKNKTVCYGKKSIALSLADGSIPDMDDSLFPQLVNEAKKLAFMELKSMPHNIAEINAKRGRNRSMSRKHRIKIESDFDQFPYYGRK